GNDKEGKYRRSTDPEGHHDTNDIAGFTARAGRQDQRYRPGYGGNGSHRDWPQPLLSGLQNGLFKVYSLISQLVGKLHQQNTVFSRQPHQHDQGNLTIYIQALSGEI